MIAAPPVVLDASALLAWLQDEPGADRVAQALGHGALMSAINWSEVLSKLADYGRDPALEAAELVQGGLIGLTVQIAPFDQDAADRAATLRPSTRAFGLSFGDRACLALGLARGARVLTADRAWNRLRVPGLAVELIR